MPRRIFYAGALVAVVVGLAPASAAAATALQTVDGQLGGKTTPKFDKKKFKSTSLNFGTTIADADNPAGMPPKATNAEITFSKQDVKFDTNAAPKCDPNAIENTTHEGAVAACGKAGIGGGTAVAALPFGVGGARQDFEADIHAFNRADTKGVLLHSRVDSLGTTVVLKGALSGTKLSIEIPPLAGGAGAIGDFNVTIDRKGYALGRCKTKHIDYSGTFTFSDAAPATATDTQSCKRKAKKGHHHHH